MIEFNINFTVAAISGWVLCGIVSLLYWGPKLTKFYKMGERAGWIAGSRNELLPLLERRLQVMASCHPGPGTAEAKQLCLDLRNLAQKTLDDIKGLSK